MAMYKVIRKTEPKIAQFAEGVVVASSKRAAREIISRTQGVPESDLLATPMRTTGASYVISIYDAEV